MVMPGAAMKRTFRGTMVLIAGCAAFGGLMARAEDPVCFEAESAAAMTPPLRLVNATNNALPEVKSVIDGASGKAFLEIPKGAGKPPLVKGGEASYSFQAGDEGDYVLWCRVWWTDECGNSFTMRIDDTAPFSFGQDSTFKCWHWVKTPLRLKQMHLAKGQHSLRVSNREDGVRLDQILLTKNPKYVPVDIEKVTVLAPPASP